jgi:hypothetical protein
VADKYEGIILVGAGTLLDGNPLNNFLKRDLTFNPDGLLVGARHIAFVGTLAYICCDAGLVVVDFDKPLEPQVVTVLGPDVLKAPRATAVQFRYAFVCDADGLKILDITNPRAPRLASSVELPVANSVYVARTYAYVAAGPMGLAIVNVTNPEKPFLDQVFDAEGELNDARDVQLGITNVSQFAYVADGKNGLRVVQLTSAETPGNDGFSPRPTPRLIATYRLPEGAEALAIARGVDRDRAVDESGNQLSVFGRVGAGPLTLQERQRMYLLPDGQVWRASDNPFDSRFYKFPASFAQDPRFQPFLR